MIDTLNINAQIAIHIFKWPKVGRCFGTAPGFSPETHDSSFPVPHYSDSGDGVLLVLAGMRALGYNFHISQTAIGIAGIDEKYNVTFCHDRGMKYGYGWAGNVSLPLAVALAALMAYGAEYVTD